MYINEYGSRDDPTVILLAPMMVSGSDLYNLMKPCFRRNYHIVAPDQGGHGQAGGYRSADEEYQTLRSFLLEIGCTEIALVYGASLGVAVGWRLFFDPAFHIARAWFDGVALARNARFAEWFMKRMFRSRKKKLAKTHAEASPSLVKMYGYDFARMMTRNFERITINDIDAILFMLSFLRFCISFHRQFDGKSGSDRIRSVSPKRRDGNAFRHSRRSLRFAVIVGSG